MLFFGKLSLKSENLNKTFWIFLDNRKMEFDKTVLFWENWNQLETFLKMSKNSQDNFFVQLLENFKIW